MAQTSQRSPDSPGWGKRTGKPLMQSDTTKSRRKILVVTASVGAGHNSAAEAIVESLESLETPGKNLEIRTLDVLSLTPRLFRAYYAGGYALAVTRAPELYGLAYHLTDRPHGPQRSTTEKLRLLREWRAMKRFRQFLVEYRPDVIVNTHFLAPPVIAKMVSDGQIQTKQVVAVTDICVHRFWYARGVEHWFVPSDVSAQTLRRWGIGGENITVSGIPILSKWTGYLNHQRVLADLRLPEDKHIVLLSGGTDFTCGPVAEIARNILDTCRDVFLIVGAGRNKRLLGKLSKIAASQGRLKPIAFTDRMHEFIESASLVVTKPGGVTTAECLARAKPMVLIDSVPGHERGNAEYLTNAGAAVTVRKTDQIPTIVRDLLADPDELKRLSQNAQNLHHPAAETIAKKLGTQY